MLGKSAHITVADTRTPPAFSLYLRGLYADVRKLCLDPAVGVDAPHAVVRLMVLEAMAIFSHRFNKAPATLRIPPALEAALQIDRGRNMGRHESEHGPLRQADNLFGCKVVWDTESFEVS